MIMSNIPNRSDWKIGFCNKSILQDKDRLLVTTISRMLSKSIKMFKYKNLPDTISHKDLEIQLQVFGFNIWKKVDGKLYTFYGGLGGEPNPYYLPTIAIVANPALRYNESLKIDDNCVVMLNDYFYQGLMPLHEKYGRLLVEAEISLKFAIINARVPALVEADNDDTKKSAEVFFEQIEKGEKYGIIANKRFLSEGIKSHDFYKEAYIKDLIEAIQYIKGSWYNEIGINSAFNMKREAINEAEATLNEDILYPSVDEMLEMRRDALKKINDMFGTNIEVELDSIWSKNREQDDLVVDREKAEIKEIENNSDEGGEENVSDRDTINGTEN